MINQVSVEAIHSAAYVENYLDCVENLPDVLQRMISRMRELDSQYLSLVQETEHLSDQLKTSVKSKCMRIFLKMQAKLITAQELGDEKLDLMQRILDEIEFKAKKLSQDLKSLDLGKEETAANESKEQQSAANSNTSNTNANSADRPNKRARRSRQETLLEANPNDNGQNDHVLRSQAASTSANATKKTAGTGKKKKRKSRQNNQREETPPREEEAAPDHDEPTYCLCDQISFGEMIMCDNDLCPIEWFHFSCVQLSTKPKGKWYCPKCRGDRPNAMKPKAQFLKELERYNKESEEKK